MKKQTNCIFSCFLKQSKFWKSTKNISAIDNVEDVIVNMPMCKSKKVYKNVYKIRNNNKDQEKIGNNTFVFRTCVIYS